jgi:CheY-like chemotaxis protein
MLMQGGLFRAILRAVNKLTMRTLVTTETYQTVPEKRGAALVVEDNPIIALDTQMMLEELGFSPVETLANLAEAAEALAAHLFSFVILDVKIGDDTSLAFARQLLEKGTKFIFASGYSDLGPLPTDFEGHVILSKPYTKAQIDALI